MLLLLHFHVHVFFFCYFIESLRIHVALGTDCVCLDLVVDVAPGTDCDVLYLDLFVSHLVRIHVALGTDCVLLELVGKLSFSNCEGGVDVVGVVTPLGGVAKVVFHGVKVVEVGVVLGVHQEGEVEEDGAGQVEVEREEGEVKERRSCVTMG